MILKNHLLVGHTLATNWNWWYNLKVCMHKNKMINSFNNLFVPEILLNVPEYWNFSGKIEAALPKFAIKIIYIVPFLADGWNRLKINENGWECWEIMKIDILPKLSNLLLIKNWQIFLLKMSNVLEISNKFDCQL